MFTSERVCATTKIFKLQKKKRKAYIKHLKQMIKRKLQNFKS